MTLFFVEWLEKVAKAGLEVQKGASAKDSPPWIDDKKDDTQ
jgi:hypothetical protein